MNERPPASRVLEQLRRVVGAAADALRFFTRLPVPTRFGGGAPETATDGTAAAAPLAGAVIGAGAALTLGCGLLLGLPATPAAVFAVAVAVVLSGALHLDGLADVADGFGGGRDRERKLAIMRDSRLGTYGGAALALALFARAALVAALADRLGPAGAAGGLMACAVIARALAFLPGLLLEPARDDGLGRAARPSTTSVAIGLSVAAAMALALAGPLPGAVALLLAAAAALGVVALARRQIGGYTGDVCGAAAELGEIAALAGLAAMAPRF